LENIFDNIIKKIVETINPKSIILFGSFSNGKNNKDSDIDICVLVNDTNGLRKIAGKLYLLLADEDYPIDLIVENYASFFEKSKYHFNIHSKIAMGKFLYEK